VSIPLSSVLATVMAAKKPGGKGMVTDVREPRHQRPVNLDLSKPDGIHPSR